MLPDKLSLRVIAASLLFSWASAAPPSSTTSCTWSPAKPATSKTSTTSVVSTPKSSTTPIVSTSKSLTTSVSSSIPTTKTTTVSVKSSTTTSSKVSTTTSKSTTPSSTTSKASSTTITTSTITPSATLTCTSGSTLTTTTDCTYPTITYTYCYSAPPPLTCPPSSYPSVYHPGHCITQSTCFPVDASYLTKSCPSGQGLTTYSVSTVYSGTLAGESTATVITNVQCFCPTTAYYDYTTVGTNYYTFCLPHTNCAAGFTTSTSTNEYCATEPPASCSDVPLTTLFCQCPSGSTPVYGQGSATATATGCQKA